eukprot:Mycagemm_TRINITY_DN10303_c0_g11::TRINITY_DN10303_c0_g11_i1::g.636::m.636 type:complete len:166 gc:universal TRINITY_DN10303_c0_g11_i1:539-42(-)
MFLCLPIGRHACLELTCSRADHHDRYVCLRSSGDHVLDEVTVARSINDRVREIGRLELPETDVDRDAALARCLQLVHDERKLEGDAAEVLRLLLDARKGALIDATTLVDQVAGGCGFSCVHVADNDGRNVSLLLSHRERPMRGRLINFVSCFDYENSDAFFSRKA